MYSKDRTVNYLMRFVNLERDSLYLRANWRSRGSFLSTFWRLGSVTDLGILFFILLR